MTLPNAPQGFAATITGPTSSKPATVALSWTANPTGDAVIEYRIYRTPAAWYVPETVAPVIGTSYTDTSGELLPHTQWYYFAVAVNANGISQPSAAVLAVIPQIPQIPMALDGTAYGSFGAGSSTTLSLTTANANDVVIAVVTVNTTTVSKISSAHLNFTLRKREQVSGGPFYLEVWYAVAPAALSAEVITVTLSAALGSPYPYCGVNIFGVSGANTSTIFDSNPSLPAAVQSGDVKLSTSNANDFIFGAYRFGSTPSPTAGAGWRQIPGAGYQLVEYQIVSATQSNLDVAIGTGSGDVAAGIGDAIMHA
jgi:hypothetical protein